MERCVKCGSAVDTDFNVEGEYSANNEYTCSCCCEESVREDMKMDERIADAALDDENMGIKADKAAESPPASAPKVAPTAGGVTAPGAFYPWTYSGLLIADEECAVIKGESSMPGFSGHCGYCVFAKDELPIEWHGNYNADGLADVDAQGGITYCEVEGGNVEARIAALKALHAEKDTRYKARESSGEEFVSLWAEYHERGKKLSLQFGYTHVVFGFDCAHYRDDENHLLFDPQYVFRRAKEMRASIAKAARAAIAKVRP